MECSLSSNCHGRCMRCSRQSVFLTDTWAVILLTQSDRHLDDDVMAGNPAGRGWRHRCSGLG